MSKTRQLCQMPKTICQWLIAINQRLIAICLLLIAFSSVAQTYPVNANILLTQPSPIYLANYADASTINSPIRVQLMLNDVGLGNRQVRLKFYFSGPSISFMNNSYIVGAQPLYLQGGFQAMLTNVELAPYFEFQNLLGINPNQYPQALPEGIYTVGVEVYDFFTNKRLSQRATTQMVLFQNDPPFLNLPLNGAGIMQQNIQNIVFSWTPRQINVSNAEYDFDLVEIWDNYTPVQNAFMNTHPLYSTTTRSTTLVYGQMEPQLIPGKKYAWRIKAKALKGAEEIGVFKNNGFSEIFWFTYDVNCTAPTMVKTEGVSTDQARISWSGQLDNRDYELKFREKNADSKWYNLITPRENGTITQLRPNTTYEYTVGASCEPRKYVHGSMAEFTTLAQDEIAFAGCGLKPDPTALANQTPLPTLFKNDVVTAGDFPIVVMHATGSNGTFSGDGYVTLPFLEKFRKAIDAADASTGSATATGSATNIGKYTRIKITFNNIGVNTDFKLISGEIVANYDDKWGGMIDLDVIADAVMGDSGNIIPIKVDYEIATVTKNPDGSITITGTDGQLTNIPKSANDIVLTDKSGDQFSVPADAKEGDIKTSGKAAEGGLPTAENTNGMSSGGSVNEITSKDVTVTFSNESGFFAFDVPPTSENGSLLKSYKSYKSPKGVYIPSYKAISDTPNTDVVTVKATFANGKKADDLVFKTENGTAIETTWSDNNTATLDVIKKFDFAKETIIATVKPAKPKDPKDKVGKYEIAGTMHLWHLGEKFVNVKIIGINGATIPDKISSELNAIYSQAGIYFKVETKNVTIANTWGDKIQVGNSGLLDTYTDAEKSIIENVKKQINYNPSEQVYYMLVTDVAGSKSDIKGFMPLKSQFGFAFAPPSGAGGATIAHELGHGVFGLQHPFDEYKTSQPTNLLMDYGTGTELSHNDWEKMHAPGLQLYQYFQGDSAGELTSEKCEAGLKSIIAFLDTGKVNYLKLLACEYGKETTINAEKKTYKVTSYVEDSNLTITHYKNWSTSNPVQELYLIDAKDAELSKNKINRFWMTYAPNQVDGKSATVDVTVWLKDQMPKKSDPKFCTKGVSLPKGISAGAAFSDVVGQVVFYGSLGVASAEIMGGIKATQCASGFILDAGLQMGINAIVKTYLSEKFTTKQLVKEISLPSATVSCATSALVNNCGTKCAGISGFAVGFGDDVWNQIKSGKSLTEVELSQSALNGLKQGILNIIVQKAVGFGISKFTSWKGKYTAKQVEDALEDLEKNPGKYLGAEKTVIRESWNGFKNIFKANANEIAEATSRIKNYRTTNNLKGGNFGYIEGNVKEITVDSRFWRSGPANTKTEPQIFTALEVEGANGGTWLRNTDSEYKMLNKLAEDLGAVKNMKYPNIEGELRVISENPYCVSCAGIIQQFNEMYPNIKLILIDGAK